MKNTVIYHKADYDGIFSREVAKKFLPADTIFIGWDYGDETPIIEEGSKLYMIDISVEGLMLHPDLVWIDHHISAIQKYNDHQIKGYRIDGVAACRLAWQWFTLEPSILPEKHQFDNRKVNEPFALTLAGEYDVWVHKGDGDIEFQFGLDAQEKIDWDWIFDDREREYVDRILASGKSAMNCYAKRDGDVMRERSFVAKWEGLTFLALNTPRCNSNTFASKDVPETGHDALMAFFWNGKVWTFSLYHAAHRKDIDLSLIASKYGGGGHKGACGFRLNKFPF